MTRRQALSATGGAVSAATCLYAWSERRGLQRDDLDPVLPTNIPKRLASLLRYAALAPSGHNTQPWTVRITGDGLRIGSDPKRWLPQVDPHNRELALSIGAFLENLIAASPGHGYKVDYTVIANTPKDANLVDVRLSPAQESDQATLERIRLRRTVRNGQLRRPLSSADIGGLLGHTGANGSKPTSAYFFPTGSAQSRYLAAATIEANQAQASREDAQEELADWIRFSNAEARAHRDGLTPESLEISGFPGWYIRHFMDRASVMKQSFRHQGLDRVRQQVENCGGWLLLTSPDSALVSLLETGRRTERIWLEARDRRIAIHPMTQVLEESPFCDQVSRDLAITYPIQFVLRVGFVDRYPQPVSLRGPITATLPA